VSRLSLAVYVGFGLWYYARKENSHMKVKIGNIVYDSNDQPLVVILGDADKENIKNMAPDAVMYCCYPEGMSIEQVREFMGIADDHEMINLLDTDDDLPPPPNPDKHAL
jgi:hypothetical protein